MMEKIKYFVKEERIQKGRTIKIDENFVIFENKHGKTFKIPIVNLDGGGIETMREEEYDERRKERISDKGRVSKKRDTKGNRG